MINTILAGVGGQGTVLASKILANAAQSKKWKVRTAETIGMSQRGGSVVTYVKYGDKVYSPVVEKGEADLIVSFEQLEAARSLPYLKKGGTIITSTQKLDPMPVITGATTYPEDIFNQFRNAGVDFVSVNALELAEQAGSAKASNVVLMGVVSTKMSIEKEVWLKALEECVPAKFLELNKKAFELGRECYY
jgi:indolepyruvate ferredoxin oxidoreductase beta subunit